ncbi:MAG: GGDEF domain-containing protein [Nitrospira sp.]|nr:diguanylate cyclase [Candidatus Manganitrophaceae bacterium]HIL34826.1 diguanylate cyclase [Candidatus Manganitrophaceae bacterium]
MNELQSHELMTKEVTCVSPETKITEVIRLIHANRHSCLVVTEKKTPVGIITERDLIRVLASLLKGTDATKGFASEIMSSPPITLDLTVTVFDALVVARSKRIRHLPVVNPLGEIAGLLTQTDLVRSHFMMIEKIRGLVELSVTTKTEELKEANKELKALALEDALLGIGNRRAMEVDLQYTHSAAIRYKKPYSVILLDIDHFKEYNDDYGHLMGDKALKEVADSLKSSIRQSDRLYRYGGEEFLLILPETTGKQAEVMGQRMVKRLADYAFLTERIASRWSRLAAG